MYYYRIAILTLKSRYQLRSFESFACEECDADVTLEATNQSPQPGNDQISGSIVHRVQPDGWYYHSATTDDTGLFVSSDYSSLKTRGLKGNIISGIDEWFVRIALECWLARHGHVSLHAAAVELNGQALAFAGPSGIGKSTRADMMIRFLGAKLINGDRPLISTKSQQLYGVPWDGKEQCFRNVHYPLQAICEVRRSESVYVRKMAFQQRRKILMRQCFIPMWDTETVTFQLVNITKMAASFPILRVFCGPEEKDAQVLFDILQKQEFLNEEPEMQTTRGLVLQQEENGVSLIPTRKHIHIFNEPIFLNEVSAFVLEILRNPVSREDMLIAIMNRFNVEKSVASNDLDILLDILNGYDLIDYD